MTKKKVPYSTYVVQTKLYGVIALLALLVSFHALWVHNLLLFVICLLIIWVALDNFFCGCHLAATGKKVKTHYVIPPFLKS